MPERISFKNRRRIESFSRLGKDVSFGAVRIDAEACDGCGYCLKPCPANVLEIVGKKCRMVEEMPFCIACGDCAAICPQDCIEITSYLQFNFHFKYLDRGKAQKPRKF